MIYIIVIIVVGISVYFLLGRIGSVRHQVKFYTKRYSKLLYAGHNNEEIVTNLLNFFLRGEPEWKNEYMKGRLNEYFNSFDLLVHDIILLNYMNDPNQETLNLGRFGKPASVEHVSQLVDNYLCIYKARYLGSHIFNQKTKITLKQLAEGVVWIPHMANEMNKAGLDHLTKAFEIDEESERISLEVEYYAFCFSLWWLRYASYVESKDKSKTDNFNKMVLDLLNSYFQKKFPSDSDYFDTIRELYDARVESYQKAYNTEEYFVNISDLLFWLIGFSLSNEEPCPYPVKVPVPPPTSINIQGKMMCAAVTTDLWKFIDKHMEGWELV